MRSVTKQFGKTRVLQELTLDIAEGDFLSVLGESGSGKTTLLRLIAGFEACSSGEIWMSGERLDVLPPYKRSVNTVFQHYALFPHLSVFDNVAYGLVARGTQSSEIKSRVDDVLAMVSSVRLRRKSYEYYTQRVYPIRRSGQHDSGLPNRSITARGGCDSNGCGWRSFRSLSRSTRRAPVRTSTRQHNP